ncbi:outer membrane protein insertion porin family [Elusimicrobium simillimum]|uniref:outer membrane protein assembly factor BamA n=1 Tax=Elusimicrobium simillimum TaxID=3143438 RepID=UPI003C6EE9B5
MKKLLFLLFLSSAIVAAAEEEMDPVGPWMVCETAVTGLNNITPKTVLKAAHAKKGEMYEKSYVYEDMQSIIALGNFDNVEVDLSPSKGTRKNKEDKEAYQCHKVTYKVQEKPIFDKIIYQGRKKLSRHAITEAMTLKLKDPYNETKLSLDMDRIKAKYAEKGYINANVSYSTTFNKEFGTAEVTLIINEGARARIFVVDMDGAAQIPAEKVIKKSANRPGKVFKPQNLQADLSKMILYGRNKGYSEYNITQPKIDMNEDKSEITLSYEVTEGIKAFYGETTFEGNTVFSDEELAKLVFYRPGQKYKEKSFGLTWQDVSEKYADNGYLAARINPIKKVDENGKLDITFDISESHIFYVDHVDVSGYETTKKNVLAREITVKPGDLFSAAKIKRSQTKLMNLGFLNNAEPKISGTPSPDRVDVDFEVAEGRPGMFSAGIAMSSLDGLYGEVSLSHMNLFGRAQRLNLRTQFGKNLLDYSIGWSTPWVFDRPVSFGVDAFNTRRYRPYQDESRAYTDRRIGGRVRIGPRFSEDIYLLSMAYTLQNIEIYDIDDQFQNDIKKEDTLYSSFSVDFAIDTRDNMWDPTSGWRNSIGLELAGGPFMGDLDLWTVSLRSIFNHTVFNIGGNYPVVFVWSNKFASTNPYGRTKEVPVYERYFIGGADTVRGYDHTGEVGPPDGGDLYFVSNIELRFPLAREGRRNIAQLATFLDIGNTWKSVDDIKFKIGSDQDEFKAGVGVGLRFATPQLPIRIDWGYGLNHKPGDSRAKFYFNMSNSF